MKSTCELRSEKGKSTHTHPLTYTYTHTHTYKSTVYTHTLMVNIIYIFHPSSHSSESTVAKLSIEEGAGYEDTVLLLCTFSQQPHVAVNDLHHMTARYMIK